MKPLRSPQPHRSFIEEVTSRDAIEQQLSVLEKKRHASYPVSYIRKDLPTADLLLERKRKASSLLSRDLRAGEYEFVPVEIKQLQLDKSREIYTLGLSDILVHGVVANAIARRLAPRLSRNLYSYIEGRSSQQAIKALTAFIKRHVRARPDPRTRGLYVLRRDVRKYTETIPIGERSPLWGQLRELFPELAGSSAHWALLQKVIRPAVIHESGTLISPIRGVPTGSPVSGVIANLYLADLDRELESIPGAFYARFGDDFVFAHEDPAAAQRAEAIIRSRVRALGLSINPEKEKNLYFNGAGRASEAWPGARGTTHVEFLGYRMTFGGTVGLRAKKQRLFFSELKKRVKRTTRLVQKLEADPHRQGRLLCAALNRAVDVRSRFSAKHASALRTYANDRAQLRQMDYWIARFVAEAVSGVRGARAFRAVPYRVIRGRWGLISLLNRRNSG